jgi:hypothetical protein
MTAMPRTHGAPDVTTVNQLYRWHCAVSANPSQFSWGGSTKNYGRYGRTVADYLVEGHRIISTIPVRKREYRYPAREKKFISAISLTPISKLLLVTANCTDIPTHQTDHNASNSIEIRSQLTEIKLFKAGNPYRYWSLFPNFHDESLLLFQHFKSGSIPAIYKFLNISDFWTIFKNRQKIIL